MSRTSKLAGALGIVLVSAAALTTPASAAPAATTTDPVAAAAGWLTTQFVDSSHLPSPAGDHFDSKYGKDYYPNYGENADVVFGLAAARAGADKIATALGYLRRNVADYGYGYGNSDGAIAKMALAAIVAGTSPTSFGGKDLLADLTKDECAAAAADGSCAAKGAALNIYSSVSESLVLLAEKRGGTGPSADAVSYFLSLQCPNGAFTGGTAACTDNAKADLDATSYAVMALSALGDQGAALGRATAWLVGQRQAGGYWVSQNVPNVNSTGLAAAALAPHGVDVSASTAWLRSQQVPAGTPGAGALRYGGTFAPTTTSATSLSVLATAQGLLALGTHGSLDVLSAAGATPGVQLFAPTAAAGSKSIALGGTQHVTAQGFAAGESVRVVVHSTPVRVATVTAGVDGSVTASFRVPASLPAGAHTVQLTGAASGLTVSVPFTVQAAPATSVPGTTAPAPAPSPATTGAGTAAVLTANTGLPGTTLAVLGGLGLLAIAGGLGLTLAARRRDA